jgi:hypothetical protein
VLGQPGQFAACLLPAHASTEAAPILVQHLHVCFHISSYSIVLLAVAEIRAPAPLRHQPEDKSPRLGRSAWGRFHLAYCFHISLYSIVLLAIAESGLPLH